ncbi:F0F1 ATP synthase subunit epsilon [Novosphingobium mangrovi (ex Huang et al. 2023)]|uniref:ATP synthase epsilon chain n=1 Tax=Novosphingobium mangrovi (ex Huang et al. 2023) TaxID=2976432 RepID=A0ABT2I0W1_9SPHN|nr:F0F1 ATP synthase subunit epsilon [Novosphingobium mangrovi (ex Huang et al. 2023)]MCT2398444.1 F0F1 ATP synthase subunit epsilon [Novosphingobium mangrovi (ex Huang et al. 2023)]
MTGTLHLSIATPETALVDVKARMVRAMDESGSFGILPGHADFLTVLPSSLVRWRDEEDALHYCAVRSGVLTVSGGKTVAIACREAMLGDKLDVLEAEIVAARQQEEEEERCARVEQAQMHARAVRQLMRYMMHDGGDALNAVLAEHNT